MVVQHLTMGNGGQWLSINFNPESPAYLAALALEHGYLRYSVNQTTLAGEMVSSVTGVPLFCISELMMLSFSDDSSVMTAQ